ncbi:MAG: site-specific integrase [Phycisphaerales bacterium]|nr:MAG: site-specific integrase [Phycisphaerales bacterium]
MGRLFKKTVTRRRKDGTSFTQKTNSYYGEYEDPRTGRRMEVPLKTGDRSAAKMKLDDLERKATAVALGLIDKYEMGKRRPLTEHIADWKAALAGKGNTTKHVNQLTQCVTALCNWCKFETWVDVNSADVYRYLGRLQDDEAFKRNTQNRYLQSVKQFVRWMQKEKRAPDNPLFGMEKKTVDDEEQCGTFEPDELRTLLEETERGRVRRGMTGFDRRLLYQLAAETGFRSNECRTMAWGDVDLEGNPPTVSVTVKRAKNRKAYDQPLTASLAQLLACCRDERGEVDRLDLVFPKTADETHVARVLRADMKAADIDECDSEGNPRNFHSLRRTFCTNIQQAGVHPADAQDVMRHSDIQLTMRYYQHPRVASRVSAIGKLPDLTTKPTEANTKAG